MKEQIVKAVKTSSSTTDPRASAALSQEPFPCNWQESLTLMMQRFQPYDTPTTSLPQPSCSVTADQHVAMVWGGFVGLVGGLWLLKKIMCRGTRSCGPRLKSGYEPDTDIDTDIDDSDSDSDTPESDTDSDSDSTDSTNSTNSDIGKTQPSSRLIV